ncbi:MAG TPA: hypothetical protein VED41_00195, partial [Solirubrobacteraceae bacterium]|nr:hypothetical protein [Solirubrobacteraceae bacterium]
MDHKAAAAGEDAGRRPALDSAQRPPGATAEAKREVCCSMTSVLVALVRRHAGEDGVAELLRRAGCV